ncbi:MAG: hypothetical protein ISR45_07995 [Rhodospirillales bacterium]|nr:hypothetical protein [Rhodospirillales bacterium]
MAIEIRRLIVNEDELKQICTDYIASGDAQAPKGAVMSLKIEKDSPFKVSVHIQTSEGQQIPFQMDENQLVTALIGYCALKMIPVSRNAKKTVKKTDKGMIAFDMVLQSTI